MSQVMFWPSPISRERTQRVLLSLSLIFLVFFWGGGGDFFFAFARNSLFC